MLATHSVFDDHQHTNQKNTNEEIDREIVWLEEVKEKNWATEWVRKRFTKITSPMRMCGPVICTNIWYYMPNSLMPKRKIIIRENEREKTNATTTKSLNEAKLVEREWCNELEWGRDGKSIRWRRRRRWRWRLKQQQ